MRWSVLLGFELQWVVHPGLRPAFHSRGSHAEAYVLPSTIEASIKRSASCIPQQRIRHQGLHPALHNRGFRTEVCILPSTREGSAPRPISNLPQQRVPHWILHPAFHNGGFCAEVCIPPSTITSPPHAGQAGCTMIPVWSQLSNEYNLPHLIADDIYMYIWQLLLLSIVQWTGTITHFQVFFGIHQFFALLLAHGTKIITIIANMVTVLLAFLCRTVCDILIGWNCLGDWQPRILHASVPQVQIRGTKISTKVTTDNYLSLSFLSFFL